MLTDTFQYANSMIMEIITQKALASTIGISGAYLSQLIHGHRNVSAVVAKRLADATGTHPMLWLYGTTDDKRNAVGLTRVDPASAVSTKKNQTRSGCDVAVDPEPKPMRRVRWRHLRKNGRK